MSIQCNVISLLGRLQDMITFAIVRGKQMKVLKKNLLNLEFLTQKEHKIQKQPLRGILQKKPLEQKPLLK